MEILNTVIALLGLLATVILGTAKITWTIAQVFFRDMHHAKHYIKKQNGKKNDRPYSLPNSGGHVSQNVTLRAGADHCAVSAFP